MGKKLDLTFLWPKNLDGTKTRFLVIIIFLLIIYLDSGSALMGEITNYFFKFCSENISSTH